MKHSGEHSKYSAAQVAEVKYVKFSVFSKDELEAWSVAEITETRLYEGTKPVRGGPNDLRLGVSSMDQRCESCGENRECQGHFGHIKLAEPVFHYAYMKFIQKILKCVCHNCFKIRKIKSDQQREKFRRVTKINHPGKRLSELSKMLQGIAVCPPEMEDGDGGMRDTDKGMRGCGFPIPTKIMLRNYKILVNEPRGDEKDSKSKKEANLISYNAQKVKNILEGISAADAKILGFTRSKPVDLLIQSLAVAPPQIRPSIQMNPEKRAEDDITAAYVRILSINTELKKNQIQAADRAQRIDDMEKIIASIMIKLDRKRMEKNDLLSNKNRNAIKDIKSLSERLKGKEGRFRQNLMGKRVDFSARSVVSPDSNLTLDELGVPEKIANSLTIPEEVTAWNYDRIVELCKLGKIKYLLKPSEDRKKYEDVLNLTRRHDHSTDIEKFLNYGMVVQRCLQNGDYVLFNRQPTLHRMSMMGHRVKILPYNTFRLNLSVCTPYNADFDGDEMNMHVPQSYETIAEIKHIAHVPKQVVAPKNNAPVMGIVQDALLGVYLFTMRDTFLTRQDVMNLVIWIEQREGRNLGEDLLPGELPMPAILKPEPLWTGKQVMSLIIPQKISLEIIKDRQQGYRNIKDVSMVIRRGELLSGALLKEVIGSGAGGLIHSIWLEIGPEATNDFMTMTQRIVNSWLTLNSFTVGAADIVPDQDLINRIGKEMNEINQQYYINLDKYRNFKIIESQNLHQRGKRVMDSFEYFTNIHLNNKLNACQKIVGEKVTPYFNNISKMITAKSKGSETNLTQILFLLGNQNVDGKRCPLGFSKRALPHFSKDDNSPQSRGFVFSSFYKGLKPHEFFFHAMGGREGLSDTAVKTSRTGYIQRKLIKSLEDIIIKYDGTVRDSHGNMLQKMYGEDFFLAEFIEKHKFTPIELSEIDFEKKFSWHAYEERLKDKYGYRIVELQKLQNEYKTLNTARIRLREILVKGKDSTDIEYYCPIKVDRLIEKIRSGHKQKDDVVDPLYVAEQVERLIDECIPPRSVIEYKALLEEYANAERESKLKQFARKKKAFEEENGLELFRIHLRLFLASRTICDMHKLTKVCFNGLLEEVKAKYFQALAVAGEAIGAIAAQSIGEPTTQMTLNTFHLAGVSDKNVTLGVPRLQELLDVSKNIKTPNMTIFLKNKILNKDRDKMEITNDITKLVAFEFPERHLRDYLSASRIYYDPFYEDSHIGIPYQELVTDKKRTPWVLSLVFNLKKLIFKDPWNEIKFKVDKYCEKYFQVIEKVNWAEAENVEGCEGPQLVLRCWEIQDQYDLKKMVNSKETGFNYYKILEQFQTNLKALRISGINKIRSVKTSKGLQLDVNARDALPDKKAKENLEYIIFQADGSNLRDCLAHERIDSRNTYCNDITEIQIILGIEAARQSFINQFKEIVKPYGIYINYRHLSVLADWMSTRGTMTPVNRNGINRVRDVSILRKASYEETTDILFSAAVFSELDPLKGVSERIIFGQNVLVGTANFKILIDREKVKEFKAKGPIDKREDLDSRADITMIDAGGRTPPIQSTPVAQGGYSSYYSPRAGMSLGEMGSPKFTPIYTANPTFSDSPRLGSSSPSYVQATPLYLPTPGSPRYHFSPGAGSVRPSSFLNRSGSPSYGQYGQTSSASPNYSSRHSLSPQYNTPTPISSGIGSPLYDRSPQQNKSKEEDQEDPDE